MIIFNFLKSWLSAFIARGWGRATMSKQSLSCSDRITCKAREVNSCDQRRKLAETEFKLLKSGLISVITPASSLGTWFFSCCTELGHVCCRCSEIKLLHLQLYVPTGITPVRMAAFFCIQKLFYWNLFHWKETVCSYVHIHMHIQGSRN